MSNEIFMDLDFFPLMGEPLHPGNTAIIDLTEANEGLKSVDLQNTMVFETFIWQEIGAKKYGIGGYMEQRDIYKRSEVFALEEAFRNIHLGIDIWAEAGTPIYAPFPGKIHSFKDNRGFGNYGPTIIIEHEIKGQLIYSLYGHLALSDLEDLYEGMAIATGSVICRLGEHEENGNWPPHLHFQLMKGMEGLKGDFPGVSSSSDAGYYKEICPDPNLIIGFTGLK